MEWINWNWVAFGTVTYILFAGGLVYLLWHNGDKRGPIGYCSMCNEEIYEPYCDHYTNVHKDMWQNVTIKEKKDV